MDSNMYINITLQIFGLLISMMIIVFLIIPKRRASKTDKLFIIVLINNIFLQICNVLTWVLDGKVGNIYNYLVPLFNFFMFFFTYTLIGVVSNYFMGLLQQRKKNIKNIKTIVWSCVITAVALLLISSLNGMYYWIDKVNVYHRGNLYWLSNMMGLICLIPCIYIFLRNLTNLRYEKMTIFILFLVLSCFGAFSLILEMGSFSIHILTTFILVSIYIFIQVEDARINSEIELELEKGKSALMLSQIQPHFLFNVLVGIMQLCEEDNEKVLPSLEHFAYYLRGNLDSISSDKLIPFESELKQVKDYLYLEEMRFKDRVHIKYDIQYCDFFVPTLCIQPLVENAIRHGITKKKEGGTICIHSEKIKNFVCINICDDGIGFDPQKIYNDDKQHIGLQNVKNRIKLLCNGILEIESKINEGTSIKIWIPLTRE